MILGIDPSLTSVGFALGSEVGDDEAVGTIRSKELRGPERLIFLRDAVRSILVQNNVYMVVYEGYSMGRVPNAGRAFDIGELGGVLKSLIFERKIPILLVPPTSLKMFATGHGDADKDAVMACMAEHRGRKFESDDEADAYGLMLMGMHFCSPRRRPRNRRHFRHRALAGCEVIGELWNCN